VSDGLRPVLAKLVSFLVCMGRRNPAHDSLPLEDMIERWLSRTFPKVDAWFISRGAALKKNLKLVAVICLFVGCYTVWVFEHRNAEAAMYGRDGKSEAWPKYNECDKERAVKATLSDSCASNLSYQQSRNDSQQDLFNRCMLALGISNKPQSAIVIHSLARPLDPVNGAWIDKVTEKYGKNWRPAHPDEKGIP
jgi:hypothetical protein